MKIFDTLDDNQKQAIFSNTNDAIGIFHYFPTSTVIKFDEYFRMSREYYLSHSGEKETSPFYDRLLEHNDELYKSQQFCSAIIYAKFKDKWERVYAALKKMYEVTNEYERSEEETFSGKDNISISETTDKTGSKQMVGTDTTTTTNKNIVDSTKLTDNTTTSTEATSTDKTVTTTSDDNNNIYGFNSSTAVGSDTSNSTNTEHTTGEADKNKTTSTENLDGNETYNETDTSNGEEKFVKNDTDTTEENEQKKGTNVADKTHTLGKEINGHNAPVTDLLEKEINFRDRQIFYDIVYKDIDSVIALQIY